MKPQTLKLERSKRAWGQVELARRLGVSQPYLAMLEEGKRPLKPALTRKASLVYGLPLELPVSERFTPARDVGADRLVGHLSRLEYPGFAYVRPHVPRRNPAEVLLTALAQNSLEARVAEALPWLLLRYWKMDFLWLVERAKRFDLQNRLGFVTGVAHKISARAPETSRTDALLKLKTLLDYSRLAREDSFPRPPRNDAERQWLMQNRPEEARHWNLLSDLRPEHLQYVG
ncbi:MAG: helix-turn-helix domain-containing protein [Terriglobia bacterium]